MVGVIQTQMIDASPGKTGSTLILLHGWRPQVQPLNTQISKQQKTQCEMLDLFTPV